MNNNFFSNKILKRTILLLLGYAVVIFGSIYFLKIEFTFKNENWFYLFLIFIPFIIWYTYKINTKESEIKLSTLKPFEEKASMSISVLRHTPFILKSITIIAFTFAMARPQLNQEKWETISNEGIEIVLALDVSTSMLAKDFKPNRLSASKEVAINFIKERKNDKIGLVIYEGEAFLQCPTTTDHLSLIRLFKEANSGKVKGGTAIGAGLATALNAVKNSETKSKIIILLTDGVNQAANQISPNTAADIAEALGIRVYTIGVGTNGMAPTPVGYDFNGKLIFQNQEVRIDEDLLKSISKQTGGKYFRATDKKNLQTIYKEIEDLEKSKIKITEHSNIPEKFFPFILIGFISLIINILFKNIIFKSITQ